MEARSDATSWGGEYHVGKQPVREGGSQTYPTIDGWKHVVIGSRIFPPIYQNVLSGQWSCVWSIGTRHSLSYYHDFSAGFPLVVGVGMEALL